MLKNASLRRIIVATLVLIILLTICLFPKSTEFKESLSYVTPEEIPIFLIDKMEYVARTSIIKGSSNKEDAIKEVIESLTIDGRYASYIPDGFKAIIPKDTKLLSLELKDNLLILNFSKEFLNIEEKDENKLLESLIYSLLEIPGIEKISILVEGVHLTKMPSGKKIPNVLDKTFGINKIYNLDSIKDTSKTTIYYLSKNNDVYYYVPVTKINNGDQEKIEIIIKELKTTPIYHTNLISYLASSTNLTKYEVLENSISLSFDNYLLANINDDNLLEEVKYSISYSIRDTYGIKTVNFNIKDEDATTLTLD